MVFKQDAMQDAHEHDTSRRKKIADDLRNPDVPNGLWDRLRIFSGHVLDVCVTVLEDHHKDRLPIEEELSKFESIASSFLKI